MGEAGWGPVTAFPKPKDSKRQHVDAVAVYRDGREVCAETRAGRAEYVRRRYAAWEKQDFRCAICTRRIAFDSATSDHIEPRGMGGGRRDDRQENIQATCGKCNTDKGSKRT